MSGSSFRFKQFEVGQPPGGFKINTDGVLLGAFARTASPANVLDIGTGTGVIALMLAQRFPESMIHAVEQDTESAKIASLNFEKSLFRCRLFLFASSFQNFFKEYTEARFDLIVSNPPFFVNSLEPVNSRIKTAKHTDAGFFRDLLFYGARHLTVAGLLWMILPVEQAEKIVELAETVGLFINDHIAICSFEQQPPIRTIFSLGFKKNPVTRSTFVIYAGQREYSEGFRNLMRDFFIIF